MKIFSLFFVEFLQFLIPWSFPIFSWLKSDQLKNSISSVELTCKDFCYWAVFNWKRSWSHLFLMARSCYSCKLMRSSKSPFLVCLILFSGLSCWLLWIVFLWMGFMSAVEPNEGLGKKAGTYKIILWIQVPDKETC